MVAARLPAIDALRTEPARNAPGHRPDEILSPALRAGLLLPCRPDGIQFGLADLHEGFGRAIITVGKLVVMDRTLRDVHRFSFSTLSKMKDEADKLLSVALEIIGKHPEVAGM